MYKEQSSGLSTQPCEEPVLSVILEESWGPSFTVYGRFVSFIQVQMEGESPSAASLLTSMSGMIVLNAELESMETILT